MQLSDLEETLETNKLLIISEYKEKNDTLNGLVAKYQTYADENEQLRKTLNNERDSHKATIDELTVENNNKTAQVTSLEQQIDQIKEAHKIALNNLSELKNLEHEKALLKAERAAQKELAKANNDYTEKIKELYGNMDKQRKTFEQKIAELEYQLSQRGNED